MKLRDETPNPMPAELARQVAELRAELAQLRMELATEVRTRRLVVVDDDGFERMHTEIHSGRTSYAQLIVEVDTGKPFGEARAVMQASSEIGDAEAYMYVQAVEASGAEILAVADTSKADAFTLCEVHGTVSVDHYRYKRPSKDKPLLDGDLLDDLRIGATGIDVRHRLRRVGSAHFDYVAPDR